MLDGDPAPLPKKWAEPPIFGPCLLWPNGWTDQDGTWHGGRPQPKDCVKWVPSPSLPKKGADNFWPISIEANRLHGSRCHFIGTEVGLDPDDIVLYGTQLSLPKKGAEPPPQFLVHVCCGQTAGWIKMALGMKVGLGPGHIVLDGDPAPLPKRGHSPNFRPIFIVTKRLDAPRCHLVWR